MPSEIVKLCPTTTYGLKRKNDKSFQLSMISSAKTHSRKFLTPIRRSHTMISWHICIYFSQWLCRLAIASWPICLYELRQMDYAGCFINRITPTSRIVSYSARDLRPWNSSPAATASDDPPSISLLLRLLNDNMRRLMNAMASRVWYGSRHARGLQQSPDSILQSEQSSVS